MKKDQNEQDFLAAARKSLDAGSDNLDPAICSRLAKARLIAVEKGLPCGQRSRVWRVAPITASLAVMLVVAFLFFKTGTDQLHPNGESLADLEIITSAEAPDFYADLDFYQWLAEDENHAG
ncbi:MAG: DUF3619 family protein [Proteobacteria bacterium]|nr:DUF3619 family protein [Pseudomonadota bacterium]MBU1546055.1 DUF3619 family protein [Pseudomonadota bacterium]MBU2618509.1 DUF3619 family protein [Pseudomonadota bacterium]